MTRAAATLHEELLAGYPELPCQVVATAIDGAARAAIALRNGGPAGAYSALVARLARDRLDVLRERHAAAHRAVRRGAAAAV
jgi:hypothetical protein